METSKKPRIRVFEGMFNPGTVSGTRRAISALEWAIVTPSQIIQRHIAGDWADMDPDDQQANQEAVTSGGRIFSSYTLPVTGEIIWVITEADRSSTRMLLPEEY